ncbi:MAG: mechanosensitive ion channel [Undibacterium sp.]|nr:mechanosensitive ion channel [Undibacterium sp.]
MLAVPNSVVMNKTVTSYTNYLCLRIDVSVTVAVTENLNRVRAILLALIEGNSNYLDGLKLRTVVVKLNDYNVARELLAWLKEERNHIQQRFERREKIFKTLMAANVEMPLETLQLAPHHIQVNSSAPLTQGADTSQKKDGHV